MKWFIATSVLAVTLACHIGSTISVEQIDAEVRAMERKVIERTLLSLFPDEDGWLVLPGAPTTSHATLATWRSAYRVVAPDSLPADAWSRFARGKGPVELIQVEGSRSVPQQTRPVGFRGMFVRFAVGGVESAALLLDPQGMRWVVWYEEALEAFRDSIPPDLDSLGLSIAAHLEGRDALYEGSEQLPPSVRFYPPLPQPVCPLPTLWEAAIRSPTPKIEGLGDVREITPDLTVGRRIIFAVPPDPLLNQEPFLLQRRLENMETRPLVLSRTTPPHLLPGIYVWAVSTLGQARVLLVEDTIGGTDAAPLVGPSVLFYGRPVLAAGGMIVDADGTVDADACVGEYGLSPFAEESMTLARHAGDRLFSRLGRLLAVLPGPDQKAVWPTLRVVPVAPPAWWSASRG